MANRGRSPGQVFGEKVETVNTSNHFTSSRSRPSASPTLDRAKMLAFYRQRFANAADFTLFMVGRVQGRRGAAAARAVRRRAAVDGHQDVDASRTSASTSPTGVSAQRVEKGASRARRRSSASSPIRRPTPLEQERIIAATTVLEIALRDALREELGQTYTVSVGLSQSLPQRGDGYIDVQFGAAPENIDADDRPRAQEVKRLQQEGPSADLWPRPRKARKRDYETSLQAERLLAAAAADGAPARRRPERHPHARAAHRRVTPAVVQETFRKYFPLDRYTVVDAAA